MATNGGLGDTERAHVRVIMFALPALSTQLTRQVSLGCNSLYEKDKENSTFPVSHDNSSTEF